MEMKRLRLVWLGYITDSSISEKCLLHFRSVILLIVCTLFLDCVVKYLIPAVHIAVILFTSVMIDAVLLALRYGLDKDSAPLLGLAIAVPITFLVGFFIIFIGTNYLKPVYKNLNWERVDGCIQRPALFVENADCAIFASLIGTSVIMGIFLVVVVSSLFFFVCSCVIHCCCDLRRRRRPTRCRCRTRKISGVRNLY